MTTARAEPTNLTRETTMQTNADLCSVLESETVPTATDGERRDPLGGPRVILYLLVADLLLVAAVGVTAWWLLR